MSLYSDDEEDPAIRSVQHRLAGCLIIDESSSLVGCGGGGGGLGGGGGGGRGDGVYGCRRRRNSLEKMHEDSMAVCSDDASPDQLIDYSKKYTDNHDDATATKMEDIDLPSSQDETTDYSQLYSEWPVEDDQVNDAKAAKFDCDALETPLMFSRTSSFKSLTDCDLDENEVTAQDEDGSFTSHCSRKSTYTSFSDLPDSPGQTLPPSPKSKHESTELKFRSRSSQEVDSLSVNSSSSSLSEDFVDGVNESEILHKCLVSGLPRSESSSSLSEGCDDDVNERELLQQCLVAAGMGKSVPKQRKSK